MTKASLSIILPREREMIIANETNPLELINKFQFPHSFVFAMRDHESYLKVSTRGGGGGEIMRRKRIYGKA